MAHANLPGGFTRLGVIAVLAALLLTACGGSSGGGSASRSSSELLSNPELLPDPVLGTAGTYGVLGASAMTNTGPTTVGGNVGVFPGLAITGLADITFAGAAHEAHEGDAHAQQAQADLTIAFVGLQAQMCNVSLTGLDLGLLPAPLTEGVYCFSSSAGLTGTLTLDAQGDPGAMFIFQIGTALTTATDSSVELINGARDCNVFWVVGSSATLGTRTAFRGNILALADITLVTGATIIGGSALARNGAVTLDTNVISVSSCNAVSADTETTVTAFPDIPMHFVGNPVLLTATVTSAGGPPTGFVTFLDGGIAIGPPVGLVNGVATLSTSALAIAVHSITAEYAGDLGFNASTSPAIIVDVCE